MISLALCLLIVAFAVVGPLMVSHSPEETDILSGNQGPSAAHWFGTDQLGRDIFARTAAGARLSLLAPTVIVALSSLAAVFLALVSSWFGGWVDTSITRVLDILFAFPSLLFALIAVAVFGTGAMAPILALALAYVPYLARLARVEARRERNAPYIAACSLLGMSGTRVALRHMLPSLWPVMRTQAAITFGGALTDFAAISFIGLGVQAPSPEWGAMVSSGRTSLLDGHPEEALFPGLLIVVTVVAFNLLADRLAKREEGAR
ncbi:ABC transporter permease [Streptomyces phaeolivaceus]|uniref:ABC transporter permease n=1 Tax=Streptomyces phaeolivaceus TaxID=2653200 RepID=A0A5P8KIN0_9ACTN|nr:ABC transporter permease [Streptomyces phaeolivaceus]